MAFAQHEVKLSARQSDGRSLRVHLESVRQQTGKTPEELEGPQLPVMCEHWWFWWGELDSGRQAGLGIQPIAWLDILAWATLTRRTLEPDDVDALRQIDAAVVRAQREAK